MTAPKQTDTIARGELRRIALLCNAASGAGRAKAHSDAIASALNACGHHVRTVDVSAGVEERLQAALAGADLLVVVGGDGTMHRALPSALASGVVVTHAPMGTENLFAREFGMSREPGAIVEAVRAWRTRRVDLGRCNAAPFAMCVGAGFDAQVVHGLHARRRGAISKLSYVRPIASAAVRVNAPAWTVIVDGRTLADHVPGQIIISNAKQYAARLNPAPHATVEDGRLDVAMFPFRTGVGLAAWAALARCRLHERSSRFFTATGERIHIHADGRPFAVQCDGEAFDAACREMTIEAMPSAMKILTPSGTC